MVDRDDLHRQAVLADEPLRGHLGVGLGPADLLVPTKIVRTGQPEQAGEAGGVLVGPLGRPYTLGDLRTVIGLYQDQVTHGRAQVARVEVEQAAVTVETHRAELAHGAHPNRDGDPTVRPAGRWSPPIGARAARMALGTPAQTAQTRATGAGRARHGSWPRRH